MRTRRQASALLGVFSSIKYLVGVTVDDPGRSILAGRIDENWCAFNVLCRILTQFCWWLLVDPETGSTDPSAESAVESTFQNRQSSRSESGGASTILSILSILRNPSILTFQNQVSNRLVNRPESSTASLLWLYRIPCSIYLWNTIHLADHQ